LRPLFLLLFASSFFWEFITQIEVVVPIWGFYKCF
jgi:hypothetical protein